MKTIIGIMGPGDSASATDIENAYQIGKFCAEKGWVVLTGGRNVGVMEAGLKGAKDAGGLTVGILPNDDVEQFSEYVDVPIVTNMRSGRNYLNALSSSLLVACGMEAGTSSEVSLALTASAAKNVLLVGVGAEAETFYKNLSPKRVFIAEGWKGAIEMFKNEKMW